jgi:hypothetical protein
MTPGLPVETMGAAETLNSEMTKPSLLQTLARRQTPGTRSSVDSQEPLIDEVDIEEFLTTASRCHDAEMHDILQRAISFALQSGNQSPEVSFLSLSAALESALTFFRRQSEYEILGARQFSELERDLKKWLKQHPALANEPAKRGLIYEKVPELNRFPVSTVFKKFCAHYSLDLSDLWPVVGKHADWPLMEVRHRLVHGDPFRNRPAEALACAQTHLSWVVERMLLCTLGWPIARSNVRAEYLDSTRVEHQNWQIDRAKFA